MSTAPFHPRAIQHTVAAQFLALAAIAYASLRGWDSAFAWAIPVLLSVAAVGMKFAAPRAPFSQIGLVALFALGGNAVTDWLVKFTGAPVLNYAGDLVIALGCVYWFGRRWVKHGFLPQSAAAWT